MIKTITYPLHQSPLFRLSSKKRLALLLGVSVRDLELLLKLQPDNFKRWQLGQKERDRLIGLPKKKPRTIQQPKPALNAVHKRLALLLGRIEKPSFVYSATKRRSYVDNALQHQNDLRCVKVDIKEFYPHVKFGRVRKFFKDQLECADDIAHLLTSLCCVDGALPTGSAISPVLSFFACSPMFGRIDRLAKERKLVFSLYVDDMVFSGITATRAFAEDVRLLVKRYGFVGHKITCYKPHQVKVVTGVAVRDGVQDLPFERQRRIRLTEEAFARANKKRDLHVLGTALIGQYREAERIRPGIKGKAARVQTRIDALDVEVRKARKNGKMNIRNSYKVFDGLRVRRSKLRAAAKDKASGTSAELVAAA